MHLQCRVTVGDARDVACIEQGIRLGEAFQSEVEHGSGGVGGGTVGIVAIEGGATVVHKDGLRVVLWSCRCPFAVGVAVRSIVDGCITIVRGAVESYGALFQILHVGGTCLHFAGDACRLYLYGYGEADYFHRLLRVGASGKEQRQGGDHSCRPCATGLVLVYTLSHCLFLIIFILLLKS